MDGARQLKHVSLPAVFLICWAVGTVVPSVLVDYGIYYEPSPHYRVYIDEATWPVRVCFSLLLNALQAALVVSPLALWRRFSGVNTNA